MQLHYLEIVTPDVEAVCTLYEKTHGVSFSEAKPELGGARTVRLPDGLTLGVRAPMHDGERPVVRPYLLVDDIDAVVAEAEKAGAHIAVPPMKIPGHGICAIYFQGGIEVGLWQAERP
jgi:predicted enzyme related to lactoylglutathione lyase